MTRHWPLPPVDRTLHLIGDMHFGSPEMTAAKKRIVAADLARPAVPQVEHRVQVGDLTDTATSAQDIEGLTWMQSLSGTPHYVIGNHDMWGVRTAAQAATAWGLPGKDYTVDLGYALLAVIGPDGINSVNLTGLTYAQATLDWLDAQLTSATKPVIVAAHPPLQNTVGLMGGAGYGSSESVDFSAQPNAGVRAVLAEHAGSRSVAWVSGHTHSPVDAPYLVKNEPVGTGAVLAVNALCLAYTGTTKDAHDPLISVFLTVTDDAFEVRFRDHGAHQWVGGGPAGIRAWSVPF